jgi:hypothetical protein
MNGHSNEKIDRKAVMEFLLGLPLRERVRLLNEALKEFEELDLADNGKVSYKNTYLVAQLTFSKQGNELQGGAC